MSLRTRRFRVRADDVRAARRGDRVEHRHWWRARAGTVPELADGLAWFAALWTDDTGQTWEVGPCASRGEAILAAFHALTDDNGPQLPWPDDRGIWLEARQWPPPTPPEAIP